MSKFSEYTTMLSIVPELDLTNFDDVNDFADDCLQNGYRQTYNYLLAFIGHNEAVGKPLRSCIEAYLGVDFTGC